MITLKMVNNVCLVAILLFLGLSCFPTQIQCKKNQGSALGHLYKAKYFSGKQSAVNASTFQAPHVDDSRIQPQDGLKEKDRIISLPGQPLVQFSQYGGYVRVDQSAGRAMYHYLAEALHSKETLPLLLWLNGGPGCSSLAYGAMQELGPFRVHSDGETLYKNKFSWNHAENVLFIESPAGVGFSYSNTTSDYKSFGDKKTAEDNYVFLVNWLERFPEYKGREFYLSGESYAGHYVPQLAHTILYHNNKSHKTIINLKGILLVQFDPCSYFYVIAYLNRPDVQEAMHANVTKLDHDWQPCSYIIDGWNDSPSTVFPLPQELMANGIRVWVFSVDTDGVVPVTSTQYSINEMKLPIKTACLWGLATKQRDYASFE